MEHLTLKQRLEMPFQPERIHWRVGATNGDKTQGLALAYLDARDVMRRLDEACGLKWQNRYPLASNSLLICEIGIEIEGEWIWRSNGAGDTDVEAEKGKSSTAFKRAAVQWGVGRYLYALKNNWTPIKPQGRSFVIAQTPELPPYATPEGYLEILKKRGDI